MKRVSSDYFDQQGRLLYDGDIVFVELSGSQKEHQGKILYSNGEWVVKGDGFEISLLKGRPVCYYYEKGNETLEERVRSLEEKHIENNRELKESHFTKPLPELRQFRNIQKSSICYHLMFYKRPYYMPVQYLGYDGQNHVLLQDYMGIKFKVELFSIYTTTSAFKNWLNSKLDRKSLEKRKKELLSY